MKNIKNFIFVKINLKMSDVNNLQSHDDLNSEEKSFKKQLQNYVQKAQKSKPIEDILKGVCRRSAKNGIDTITVYCIKDIDSYNDKGIRTLRNKLGYDKIFYYENFEKILEFCKNNNFKSSILSSDIIQSLKLTTFDDLEAVAIQISWK